MLVSLNYLVDDERFVTGLEQNQHRTGAYVDVQLLYSCTFTESMN